MTKRVGEPQRQRGAHNSFGQEGGPCSTPLQKYISPETEMELLYRGFDGLDVSFQGRIDYRFCAALEEAKLQAQKFHRDEYLEWCDIGMLVKESGARGGYAFCVRTASPQAVWFFKKPNPHDPWGIRVSCDSFQLALQGLSKTRGQLLSVLDRWKIEVPRTGESISRVDYALDFLDPALVLEPSQFVMHSNTRRSDHHSNIPTRVEGKSGRVTSVTVGQMPGKQVIVYDKRAEIIAKRKFGWQTIWDASRKHDGKPALDHSDPSISRVWRVEVRAGKKFLKDTWAVRTWLDLDEKIGDVFAQVLEAIRYTVPSADSNRARWPEHPLWEKARQEILLDLFEMRNFADPETVKLVQLEAHDQLLAAQMQGLLISRAALNQISHSALPHFIVANAREIIRTFSSNPAKVEERLLRATRRYAISR